MNFPVKVDTSQFDLNALVVNLAPSGGIGDVAERRKIDVRDKLVARSRQNYDLVRDSRNLGAASVRAELGG